MKGSLSQEVAPEVDAAFLPKGGDRKPGLKEFRGHFLICNLRATDYRKHKGQRTQKKTPQGDIIQNQVGKSRVLGAGFWVPVMMVAKSLRKKA